jgi:hypothetical protein
MGNVVIDMSMSLDGYIAASNDNPERWAGEDGMRLHNWAFDDPSLFERVYGRLVEETGALVMGPPELRQLDRGVGWQGPAGRGPVLRGHPPAARERGPRVHVRPPRDRVPSRRPRRSPATSGSRSWARSSTSNTSRRGSWTRSESTWSTSCSEEAAGCSTSSRGKSSWNGPGSPRPTAQRISSTTSAGRY